MNEASGEVSAALPPDLLDEVRGRLRLLTLLLFAAFVFDALIYAGTWAYSITGGHPPGVEFIARWPFQAANLVVAAASAYLWWAARANGLRSTTLLNLGLGYEVLVCFVIGLTNTLDQYRSTGLVPTMDWVPSIVILFPLVLPGPPRRMLVAAAIAAMMSPLAQGVLHLAGLIPATMDTYVSSIVHAVFAVVFAYMGAKVVYGLGREVVRARELGSYRLGELLGRGGMGEVYRATHRMLARPAAIKLIRAELLGPDPARTEDTIRRFRREAEVAAQLRSPHTVELYDFGVTPDRSFYFVMELLEGMDLEKLVRQVGPLPAGRVVHLVRQVCASLEEAHAAELVHRDIKPANLHVGRLGLTWDFLKVLDFGLVKSVSPGRNSALATQGEAAVAGTPAYMAPEVVLGEPVDGRTDVYAVGCVTFFLLTGHTVFETPSAMAALAAHVHQAPVAPSSRSELAVPAELDRLVLQCLAKDPAARPRIAQLSQALGDVPVVPWLQPDARRWWSEHRPEARLAGAGA